MTREETLNDAMTAPEATEIAPGLLVRKIGLQSLSMLSRINSPFADISAAAKGEAQFRMHELAEFVFIHAAPQDDVLRAYYNGGHLGLSRAADAFAAAQAAKVKSIDDEIDALKRLQAQREQERRIAAADVSDRPAALLRSAGFSAASTGANLDSAIAFTEEQMSLAKAGFASDASYEELAAELKNLLELREKYQLASEAADAQSVRAEQSRRAEEQRLALLRAELSGNAQLAEQLREQARLEELIAANKNAGMDDADAERLARERVSLERAQAAANAAGAGGAAQRVGAGTVGTAQASVGGGRSVSIGMSGAISVAREQLSAARQMLAALNKIVSNTENPAAGAAVLG